jgi:putative glutamine amidotransferase
MNVAFGGSLFQDNKAATDFNHSIFDAWNQESHPITLVEGTILHGLFGCKDLKVNSLHHQSIREVGEGLRVSSLAPDGVVESVEHKDMSRFILGIQWHPEMLRLKVEEQNRIFDAFIEACKAE